MDLLDRLEARIAALEDREAIRNLIAAYGPAADAGDAEAAAALWAEDGRYEVGGFGTHVGRGAVQALLEGEHHRALIAGGAAHLLGPLRIELNGDEATATGHSIVLRREGEGWAAHRVAANRWRLRREATGWRVVERVNRLLDGDAAARALLAPGAGAEA